MKMKFIGETESATIEFSTNATQVYTFTEVYTKAPKVIISGTQLPILTKNITLVDVRLIATKQAKNCTIAIIPNI